MGSNEFSQQHCPKKRQGMSSGNSTRDNTKASEAEARWLQWAKGPVCQAAGLQWGQKVL